MTSVRSEQMVKDRDRVVAVLESLTRELIEGLEEGVGPRSDRLARETFNALGENLRTMAELAGCVLRQSVTIHEAKKSHVGDDRALVAHCSACGLEVRAVTRGYCGACYSTWLKYGKPARTTFELARRRGGRRRGIAPLEPGIPRRVLATFFDKVSCGAPEECWPWQRSIGSHGYGQIGWSNGGVTVVSTAPRVAWTSVHGEVPEGALVRHKCQNRLCVNPRHLEVTPVRQSRRKMPASVVDD